METDISKLLAFLDRQPQAVVWVLTMTMLLAVGAMDAVTVERLSLSLFYLVPVALISWSVGRNSGLFCSALSTIIWIAANPHAYGTLLSPLLAWNAAMRTGFFFIATLLISELRQHLHREHRLARTDFLTGALNRLAFYDEAVLELRRANRYAHSLSLLYIDLDNFKTVNDKQGHNAGNIILKTVVAGLRRNVRNIDSVARLGGDEFAVLLPQTDEASIAVLLPRLQQALLKDMSANGWPVTFSIGVLTCLQAPESVDEFVNLADRLMYRAKIGGKNNAVHERYPAR